MSNYEQPDNGSKMRMLKDLDSLKEKYNNNIKT